MTPDSLRAARRALLAVCGLAATWAAGIAFSGGFVVRLGGMRISSRDPSTPFAIALICGLSFYGLLFVRGARGTPGEDFRWYAVQARQILRALWHRGARLGPVVLLAIIASLLDIAQWLRGAPLWLDEEMIAINLRDRSFAELTGALWLGQSAPLGWLVVQRAVLLLIGSSELALRFVPLCFGIATLAAAAWIGQRWMTRVAAVFFVVICWISEWLSHFRFELKHYSADILWAMWLPALAAWAVEDDHDGRRRRRWVIWWSAAAVGQLFSNGAFLVTPACAVVQFVWVVRRHGRNAAFWFAGVGVIWLAAFALHYQLTLRFTHHNRYLRTYWMAEIPPDSAGLPETIGWIGQRLIPLGENPGAASIGAALWLGALLGFAATRHRLLSGMFVTVPLSALLLAALRLVPLYERFSVWIVPALYLGVALLIDSGWRQAVRAWPGRHYARLVLASAAVAVALAVGADIYARGHPALDLGKPTDSNHGLDDRQAVPWLMARRQPGDALLSTRLGWPAIWWYGDISLETIDPNGRLPDGAVMYQISHQPPGPTCADWRSFFSMHRRVLVHVGFPDMPIGFLELWLQEVDPFAIVVASTRFADRSRVAVLERRSDAAPIKEAAGAVALDGCVGIATVRRW